MLLSRIQLIILCTAVVTAQVSHAELSDYDEWEEDYNVQALLGAVRFDNLKFNIEDSATPEEANYSTLPQLGGAWYSVPIGERFQFGLETSLLLGFRAVKLNYLYAGGGGLYVNLSSSFWMFDLAGGAYANLYLDPGQNVRLYAGCGPLMMYASYRTEKDFSDGSDDKTETDSAFGIGMYARAGLEFRVYDKGMVGVGARGTWSNVDFSDAGGHSDLTGIAGFVTFTAGF